MNPRIVYADIIGQEGTTTRQLFDAPPEGYAFVKRPKLSNRVADRAAHSWKFRWVKQRVNSVLPVNLLASRVLGSRARPPEGAALTYSESSVVFRKEPWVVWIEVATQLAGFSHRSLRRFRGVIERALGSRHCRGIICHSHAARASLERHLRVAGFEHKIEIMPPGWPVTEFHPAEKPAGAPVRILFVAGSTMAARFALKGGRESLEAFAALRERFPNVELVVRSDVEPKIRRRYEGMPGLRLISGLLPDAELHQLYRQSDIYWYPAHCLMSVSMLEAMNHGLPVVTTDYYDNPEYVEDGVTGVVLPHHRALPAWDTSERNVRRALACRDPEFVRALVESTAAMIENPGLRRRMGRAGRALVDREFSLAEKNRKLKNILDLALDLPEINRREAQGLAAAGTA
jgi:glycosyltransferase involved in cell wall biosynthesis